MSSGRLRLYGIPLSHPVAAVRGMLDRKGLDYRYVELLGGMHPPSLLALGFRGGTVPALKLPDGRRVQGSLAIAQALEELAPSPSLYPAEAAARATAEEAERWGEAVLQPVPRRMIRWGLSHRAEQRRWFVDVATPLPAPAVMSVLLAPLAPASARLAGATSDRVRNGLADLPALLDHVDGLIERGVIGGEELGAADFQIASSVRLLLAIADVRQLVAGRPSEALALRAVPAFIEIPAALPPEWIPAAQS